MVGDEVSVEVLVEHVQGRVLADRGAVGAVPGGLKAVHLLYDRAFHLGL